MCTTANALGRGEEVATAFPRVDLLREAVYAADAVVDGLRVVGLRLLDGLRVVGLRLDDDQAAYKSVRAELNVCMKELGERNSLASWRSKQARIIDDFDIEKGPVDIGEFFEFFLCRDIGQVEDASWRLHSWRFSEQFADAIHVFAIALGLQDGPARLVAVFVEGTPGPTPRSQSCENLTTPLFVLTLSPWWHRQYTRTPFVLWPR